MHERVVVVANPTAGRGKAGRLIGKVDRLLRELGVAHEIRISESAADLQERAHEAAVDGARIVAALGGDGTIGLAANGVLGTGSTLAVLPSGTADDFATSLGVKDLVGAVRAIAEGVTADIDVVRVTTGVEQRHFVNVAGCGFDSDVNETANAMRIKLGGKGTYIAAIIRTLSRFEPAHFRVELDDGELVEGQHMLVVVGNAISYGGGMRVTPGASLVDGSFDVCLLSEVSKGEFLRTFPKVFRGSHVHHPAVRIVRARRVAIEADRRVMVYADGERVGPAPAVFDLLPAALPIVIGPGAKAIR